jgi:hypothetical protein
MFEYWDIGDRRWKTRKDEMLTDAGMSVKEYFRSLGLKVREVA